MLPKLFTTAALLFAYTGLVQAECVLENKMDEPETEVEDRTELCQPQGKGDWTFGMRLSSLVVPTFDSDNMWAGAVSNKDFIIYDEACRPQGVYSPSGNDCGIPYVIKDQPKLPYVITVNRVNFDVGGGDFKFAYANGQYMIGENEATCESMNSGLRVEVGCKTGFPIEGEPV